MIFAPILCWFSARNIPSDRWHRHQPKGRFRGWRYSCPGRHGLARHSAAQLYCQGDPKGGERRVPNGADWKRVSGSGLYFVGRLEPELGSRALRIAPTPAIRLRERHGGTFGNPSDGLPGSWKLTVSKPLCPGFKVCSSLASPTSPPLLFTSLPSISKECSAEPLFSALKA